MDNNSSSFRSFDPGDTSNFYWNPEALYSHRFPPSTASNEKSGRNAFSRFLRLGKSKNDDGVPKRSSRSRPMSYHNDDEEFRLPPKASTTKSPVERMVQKVSNKKDLSRSHSWIYGSVKLPSDMPFGYDCSPERSPDRRSVSAPHQQQPASYHTDYGPHSRPDPHQYQSAEYDFLPSHPLTQYKGVDPANWRQYALNECRKHSKEKAPQQPDTVNDNLGKKLASSVRKLTWKSLKHAVKKRPTLDAFKRWPPDQPGPSSAEPIYASNYFFPEKKNSPAIYASCTELYGEAPPGAATASVRVRPKRTRQSWPFESNEFGPISNFQPQAASAPAHALQAAHAEDEEEEEEIYHSEWDLRQFMPYDVWLQATDPMVNPARVPKAKARASETPAKLPSASASSAIYGEAIYKRNSILEPEVVTAYQLLNGNKENANAQNESTSDSDNLSDNVVSEDPVRIGGQGIYMIPAAVPTVPAQSNSKPPNSSGAAPKKSFSSPTLDKITISNTFAENSNEFTTPGKPVAAKITASASIPRPSAVVPTAMPNIPKPPKLILHDATDPWPEGARFSIPAPEATQRTPEPNIYSSGTSGALKTYFSQPVNETTYSIATSGITKPEKKQASTEASKKAESTARSVRFEQPETTNDQQKSSKSENTEGTNNNGGHKYIKRRKSRSSAPKSARLIRETIYEESDDDERNEIYAVKIIVSQNTPTENVKPILKNRDRVYEAPVQKSGPDHAQTHSSAQQAQQFSENSSAVRKKVQFDSNKIIVCPDSFSDNHSESSNDTEERNPQDWVTEEHTSSSSPIQTNKDDENSLPRVNNPTRQTNTETAQRAIIVTTAEEKGAESTTKMAFQKQEPVLSRNKEEADSSARMTPHAAAASIPLSSFQPSRHSHDEQIAKTLERKMVNVGSSSPPINNSASPAGANFNPNSLLFHDTTRIRLNQNRRPSIEQTFKLDFSPPNSNRGLLEGPKSPASRAIRQSNSFRQLGTPGLSLLRPKEPPPPPPVASSATPAPPVSNVPPPPPPPPPLPQWNSGNVQHSYKPINKNENRSSSSAPVRPQIQVKNEPEVEASPIAMSLAEKRKAVERVLSQKGIYGSSEPARKQREENAMRKDREEAAQQAQRKKADERREVKNEEIYGESSKNIEIVTKENSVSEIRIYSGTANLNINTNTEAARTLLGNYAIGMSNNVIEEVHYAATEVIPKAPSTQPDSQVVHLRQRSDIGPAHRPHSSVILILEGDSNSNHANSAGSKPGSSFSIEATRKDEPNLKDPAPIDEYAQSDAIYAENSVTHASKPKVPQDIKDQEDQEPLYDDATARQGKKLAGQARLMKESKEVIEAGKMVLKYLQNYGTKTYVQATPPPAPPAPPALPATNNNEIYGSNSEDNFYNDIETRQNNYNGSLTYSSRDEGIIYDDTLSLISSTYARSDRTLINEDYEEPIYDDVLNIRTQDSDSGAETEESPPPPLPAQGPPKLNSADLPLFPLLQKSGSKSSLSGSRSTLNGNTVGGNSARGNESTPDDNGITNFTKTLQNELEKRLAKFTRNSTGEYSTYGGAEARAQASSSESSGVEEDYNPAKNLPPAGGNQSYRPSAVPKLPSQSISLARGRFLDSMKTVDEGAVAGTDEEPIYEEIGGTSSQPIYSDAFDQKSMFKGASKSEILSFLESIRDQLSSNSAAPSETESASQTSSLTRDDKYRAGIERNDSGIGSESGSLPHTTAVSPTGTLLAPSATPLCKDCNSAPLDGTPEGSASNSAASQLCQPCTRNRSERKEILQEILKTELNYGRDLKIIRDEFYGPIKITGLLTPEQLDSIFLNVDDLIEVNSELTARLSSSMESSDQNDDLAWVNVGRIFDECADGMMNTFETYCKHQASAGALLTQLEKEKELLRIFLRVSQMENPVLRRMNLPAFLMVPVQRVTRYPLLLARLLKVTPLEHSSRAELASAQVKIEQCLEQMNKTTREAASVRLWRKISIRSNVGSNNGSSSPVHRRNGSDLDPTGGARKWPWF